MTHMGPNPHQFDKWNNKVFINIKKYKIIHSWTPSPFIKEGGIEFSKLSQTREEFSLTESNQHMCDF